MLAIFSVQKQYHVFQKHFLKNINIKHIVALSIDIKSLFSLPNTVIQSKTTYYKFPT